MDQQGNCPKHINNKIITEKENIFQWHHKNQDFKLKYCAMNSKDNIMLLLQLYCGAWAFGVRLRQLFSTQWVPFHFWNLREIWPELPNTLISPLHQTRPIGMFSMQFQESLEFLYGAKHSERPGPVRSNTNKATSSASSMLILLFLLLWVPFCANQWHYLLRK